MNIKKQGNVAVLDGTQVVIKDVQSALDLIMTVHYETGCDCVAIDKMAIIEDFFNLSTTLAGQILQKCVNYRMKLAIYGDFSDYASKALRDFMYECNNGSEIFFESTKQKAIDRLSMAM